MIVLFDRMTPYHGIVPCIIMTPSLLYCIILVIYRFLIGKILFSGSGICQSSYDEFSNILFLVIPRLVSNVTFLLATRIQKIIWITWICDEIFFGEIKRNESKKRVYLLYNLEDRWYWWICDVGDLKLVINCLCWWRNRDLKLVANTYRHQHPSSTSIKLVSSCLWVVEKYYSCNFITYVIISD